MFEDLLDGQKVDQDEHRGDEGWDQYHRKGDHPSCRRFIGEDSKGSRQGELQSDESDKKVEYSRGSPQRSRYGFRSQRQIAPGTTNLETGGVGPRSEPVDPCNPLQH